MRAAWAWPLAVAPFAALAAVLRQVPDASTRFQPMPWSHAAAHAAVLLGLLAAHAWCYERWAKGDARRIEANELLTRLWFVAFGFVVVAAHRETGWLFLAAGAAWAILSFQVHRLWTRRLGGYRMHPNLAILGLFLLGLAELGLLAIKAPGA